MVLTLVFSRAAIWVRVMVHFFGDICRNVAQKCRSNIFTFYYSLTQRTLLALGSAGKENQNSQHVKRPFFSP